LELASEISKIRNNISKERIQTRAEYEEKAKNAILANMNTLTIDSLDSIMDLMNTDFYEGKTNTDRFYPLFSVPMRNMIRTNKIDELKAFIVTAFEKEDLSRIDEARFHLHGIKYGAASLLLYIKDRDRYNVFIPSTVKGLRIVYPEKANEILYEEPFDKNYSLFNSLCNDMKKNYSIRPQELDIILTVLGRSKPPQVEPTEVSYFVLRTGGGEYSDQPEQKYNFKEGIPGYKQLLESAHRAKFVYVENGLFYGKGEIGDIESYEKDGTRFYDAQVLDYEKLPSVPYADISNKLSKPFSQAGIMKISEADYRLVTEFEPVSALKYTIDDFVTETGFERSEVESLLRILRRKKQVIFQGPPGTGKTFIAQRLAKILVSETGGLIQIVQFHPDYGYEDFIQGYYPKPEKGVLQFELKKGRFLELCDEAANQGNSASCVLIIDEINRAKLARVFGELMYLLEYRDKEIPLAAGGKPFRIPENVYIIGTMNTADRSIALVDHALRRRFSFIRLQPDYNILENYLRKNKLPTDSLITVLKRINQAIDDPNYEVGISFFMKDQERLKQLLPEIWKTEIEPYLEEYFYDQRSKVESFRWDNLAKDSLKDWA
jgi:MoxR-like ATPase